MTTLGLWILMDSFVVYPFPLTAASKQIGYTDSGGAVMLIEMVMIFNIVLFDVGLTFRKLVFDFSVCSTK